MWEILLGGFLSILGGWGAMWYQAKNARHLRMEELTAERKISANADAYSYAKEIASALVKASPAQVAVLVQSREEWFFKTRLFLPGEFPARWLELRNSVHMLATPARTDSLSLEKRIALNERAKNLAEQAIDEIYKDMRLERIRIPGSVEK